ncbi:hypothetical protein MmTuc01_2617 [Methanosarcina mazei Tuc01]|uniref:Uncharacterized protein n=1 Tax=Methanosarcina mazei Tuc01 TaxID=1236903 RepID=M1Q6H7_METMZ|nr:hypothetical protein MmTuc01_2617 [Methanosarcina mazei Tuc01]
MSAHIFERNWLKGSKPENISRKKASFTPDKYLQTRLADCFSKR